MDQTTDWPADGVQTAADSRHFEYIIDFSFRRIWRILQILEVDNTLLDLQNSSYPMKAELGYSRENPQTPPPPDGWGRFWTPLLSTGFPEAQDPPCLDFQDKRWGLSNTPTNLCIALYCIIST